MANLFFSKISTEEAPIPSQDTELDICFWRPTLINFKPRGSSWFPFGIWWAFHMFHIFENKNYCVLLVKRNGLVIHRSCIFPKYFRFPFMNRKDLQVGDTWTLDVERGKGIASLALNHIASHFQGFKIWYITDDTNLSSARIASKCGFQLIGKGIRVSRYGLKILGQYRFISDITTPNDINKN